MLKKRLHVDKLNDEMLFAINFNSHAWIGSIIDWVMNPAKMSAKDYARMMYQNTTILRSEFMAEEVAHGK